MHGRYRLELELRSALVSGEYELLYQPIHDLDDLSIIGFEALLRWNHPVRGQLAPADFLPGLESSDQLVPVGRWVLLQACRQMVAWRARGSELVVSVNVSARQLDQDVLVDDVRAALEASGLPAAALTLEITERALEHNVQATAHRLRALKEIGVQVAIDDFGTARSTLAHLQQFPADCLKIDRTFTDALARSPESLALIQTLVQLGRRLGLRTLAEGVETTAQMARLRREHVDSGPGFLFAHPMTVAAIDDELGRQLAQAATATAASASGAPTVDA